MQVMRILRIELRSPAWKAGGLPLTDMRLYTKGGTRTRTTEKSGDFKSPASTYSATLALIVVLGVEPSTPRL